MLFFVCRLFCMWSPLPLAKTAIKQECSRMFTQIKQYRPDSTPAKSPEKLFFVPSYFAQPTAKGGNTQICVQTNFHQSRGYPLCPQTIEVCQHMQASGLYRCRAIACLHRTVFLFVAWWSRTFLFSSGSASSFYFGRTRPHFDGEAEENVFVCLAYLFVTAGTCVKSSPRHKRVQDRQVIACFTRVQSTVVPDLRSCE